MQSTSLGSGKLLQILSKYHCERYTKNIEFNENERVRKCVRGMIQPVFREYCQGRKGEIKVL